METHADDFFVALHARARQVGEKIFLKIFFSKIDSSRLRNLRPYVCLP